MKYIYLYENFTALNNRDFIKKIDKIKDLFYTEIDTQQIKVNGNITVHIQFITDKTILIVFKAIFGNEIYATINWNDKDTIILTAKNQIKEYKGDIETYIQDIVHTISLFNAK